MKFAIIPICLLISIILFVIIDRKDFYSGDDVADQEQIVTGRTPTTVATLKPIEKPIETKSAEVKPVGLELVVVSKRAKTKPVAGNRSTEDTTKSLPIAIPLLTAEEAVNAYEEALRLQSKKEMSSKKRKKVRLLNPTSQFPWRFLASSVEAIKAPKTIVFQR